MTTSQLNMKKKKTEQQASPCKPSPPKPSISVKDQKLSEEFIMKVLAQQQKCKKQMTQQGILSLINMYKKLVEYYTVKQDTIALYFTEKMQNLMSCQDAIETFDKSRQTLTTSMAQQIASQPQMKFTDIKQVLPSIGGYDRQVKRKERAKKVQIFMEVKKTQKRSNAKNILNKYYEECVENNLLVVNEIQVQRKNLEDRLKAIHQKSLNVDSVLNGALQQKDGNTVTMGTTGPQVLSVYVQ